MYSKSDNNVLGSQSCAAILSPISYPRAEVHNFSDLVRELCIPVLERLHQPQRLVSDFPDTAVAVTALH